jgi:hypothetical protein
LCFQEIVWIGPEEWKNVLWFHEIEIEPRCSSSGSRMTGILLWMLCMSEFGVVVRRGQHAS